MAQRMIVTATVVVGGVSYTGSIDRNRETEDNTSVCTVEASNGLRGDGGWDDGIWGISYGGEGEMPSAAILHLEEALRPLFAASHRNSP